MYQDEGQVIEFSPRFSFHFLFQVVTFPFEKLKTKHNVTKSGSGYEEWCSACGQDHL
jgi:hypothetical protein